MHTTAGLQFTKKKHEQSDYLILSLQHKTKFRWVFRVKFCSLTSKKFLKWPTTTTEYWIW